MKRIPLSNGAVVFRLKVSLTITEYDLIAAACLLCAKGKPVSDRKKVVVATKRLYDKYGTNGFCRAIEKYGREHAVAAKEIVRKLFPEMGDVRASEECATRQIEN